jgi:hypothetical protein
VEDERAQVGENFHQFDFRFHKEKEMVDSRRSILVLAVLLLASSMAYGQTNPFTCQASADSPLIRSEGIAEYIGDIVVTCTGGTPTPFGEEVPLVNFNVRILGTYATPAILATGSDAARPWTEATLAIDDPMPGSVNSLRGAQTPGDPDNSVTQTLKGIGSGLNGAGIFYQSPTNVVNQTSAPGQVNYGTEVYNVYQGHLVGPSGQWDQVEWRGVPVDPPGTNIRTIRITNVRVNAAAYGTGGNPTPLSVFISASGSVNFPINQSSVPVGVVTKSLEASVVNTGSYLQCNSEPQAGTLCGADMLLKFEELIPNAFKYRSPTSSADIFGEQNKFQTSESNYANSVDDYNSVFTAGGSGTPGVATQGTRLLARFTKPDGVSLRVWRAEVDSTNTCGYTASSPTAVAGMATTTGPGGSYARSNSWSSSVSSAAWEITQQTGQGQVYEDIYFAVDLYYTSDTTAGIPGLGTGTVKLSYAPLSTLFTATSWSNGHPRFIDDADDMDLFTINSCSTSLLWPYITNQAGFDTGMVISNTSMDPWGNSQQSGACMIYYYGYTTGGGAQPAPVATPVVPSGQHAVWTLSTGGTVQTAGGTIAAVPGFQGYAIAICQFQYAHGYGFISDIGATHLAQGYLALILDAPANELPRSGSQSEPLNQ